MQKMKTDIIIRVMQAYHGQNKLRQREREKERWRWGGEEEEEGRRIITYKRQKNELIQEESIIQNRYARNDYNYRGI